MIYSPEILNLFSSPAHIYNSTALTNFIGYAGDTTIGEYVHLYFQVDINNENKAQSKIIKAKFSAIGGVILISAAEKFCELVENSNFQEALIYCDTENGLSKLLNIPSDDHSINFIIQAFYISLESLMAVDYSK